MLRFVVIGCGSLALNVVPAIRPDRAVITAFIDETPQGRLAGEEFLGAPVVKSFPSGDGWYDYILVACRPAENICCRLSVNHGVPLIKFVPLDFEQLLPKTKKPFHKRDVLRFLISSTLQRYTGLADAFDMEILLRSPWLTLVSEK